MPLSDDELEVVRSWVGSGPEDDDLNARFDRLGTVSLTIEEALRSQLAELINQPASLSTPDGLSISVGENMRILSDRLKSFRLTVVGASGAPSVARLYRPEER
jgi:hypothetical protein